MSSRRSYRRLLSAERFKSFQVVVKETDLWVSVRRADFSPHLPARVEETAWKLRRQLEAFIARDPYFRDTLEPYLLMEAAPPLVLEMVRAANLAGVGPMAAVAGAVAEGVGRSLADVTPEVIVENGGDIYLKIEEPVTIGIHAGRSPLSGKLALHVGAEQTPLGVCTSSGTVGPSYSRGRADAAVVLAPSAALADAAATALGNQVCDRRDLEKGIEAVRRIPGVTGALIIFEDQIAFWGAVELRPWRS